jgi:hypothetical protein
MTPGTADIELQDAQGTKLWGGLVEYDEHGMFYWPTSVPVLNQPGMHVVCLGFRDKDFSGGMLKEAAE